MIGQIGKLSAGALAGILVGIALVAWIEPDTTGGTGLVLLVGMVVTLLAAALGRALLMRPRVNRSGQPPGAQRPD